MKRVFVVTLALTVILGLGAFRASAQTWTWEAPVLAVPQGLTELTSDSVNDLLYGIQAGIPVGVTAGVAATPALDPLADSGNAAVIDLTVGAQGVVYAITDTLVESWAPPSVYTPLDTQPLIPEGTTGTFKHIAAGKNGKLFLLYETTGAEQYILVGHPPTTEITASALFSPRTLNLTSSGNWVTCNITLQEGYRGADVDLATVCITAVNGSDVVTPVCRATGSPATITGAQVMLKFSRQQLADLITLMAPGSSSATLTLEGSGIDASTTEPFQFSATDTISVITGGKGRKTPK
jgi:hypothetical protein